MSLEEIKLWSKGALQMFLRKHGLRTSGSKEELQALVFGAMVLNVSTVPSASEDRIQKAQEYRELRTVDGAVLPDPISELKNGWLGEKLAVNHWPPTMHMDIAEYLLKTSDAQEKLTTRLLKDYKEGKAYSYFDSAWLKEVMYHPIDKSNKCCYLKAEVMPSMRLHHLPHDTWVCVEKVSGMIRSAYCSCFAGLGGACNHVAAVLFKLDFIWKKGFTSKSCTSLECTWNKYTGSSDVLEPKPVHKMEWRKPHYSKDSRDPINPVARQLFDPLPAGMRSGKPLESLVNALMPSCSNACVWHYVTTPEPPEYSPCEDFNVACEEVTGTAAHTPQPLESLAKEVSSVPEFFQQLPSEYSEGEVQAIRESTRGQNTNPQWLIQRTGRITATSAHAVLTRTRTWKKDNTTNFSTVIDTIMGYKRPPAHLPALKYGISNEKAARKRYIQLMRSQMHQDFICEETGLCVCPTAVFLSASPDGLIQCKCCAGKGVLELKSPFSIAREDPQEVQLVYLEKLPSGDLRLRHTHQYYTQIQVQMGVMGRQYCDFFVFTQVGHFMERIMFDPLLWEEVLSAARFVFTQHIVPHLVAKVTESASTPAPCAMDVITPSPAPRAMNVITPSPAPHGVGLITPSQAPGTVNVDMLPAKMKTSSVKKCRGRRKPARSGPVYLCGVCSDVCKEKTEIEDDSDHSVLCGKCHTWFHWGCAGFDPETPEDVDWLCQDCCTK